MHGQLLEICVETVLKERHGTLVMITWVVEWNPFVILILSTSSILFYLCEREQLVVRGFN